MYYNLHMFTSVYMCLYVFILICLYIVFVLYIYIYEYLYLYMFTRYTKDHADMNLYAFLPACAVCTTPSYF